MKKLQVGIIGAGFIGRQHIEAIRRIPNTEVVAISEYNKEVARKIADEFGIEHAYGNVDEMIADVSLDVIHNCTPSNMHYELNKTVLNAGIHLYCEKPLTLTSGESEELVELVEEKGLKAAVNFNYRHNAMVEEMKERINDKAIGAVWYLSAEYLQDWLLKQTDFDWRVETEYGGNTRAIADIGSHCFDTIQYLLNEKIVAVRAKRYMLHPTRKNHAGVDVTVENEDAALVQIKLASGIEGVVRVSQVSAGKKNDFNLIIEGTKQALEWYQEKPDRLWVGNQDIGNTEIFADAKYLTGRAKEKINLPNGHAVGWADAFTNGINSFYQSILNVDTHVDYTDFKQAHHIMKVIDACVESDQTGNWVEVK